MQDVDPTTEQAKLVARTVAAVTDDLEAMRFNTAISRLMEFTNAFTGARRPARSRRWRPSPSCSRRWPRTSPRSSGRSSATTRRWPTSPGRRFDPALLKDDEIEVPVQINGKLRGRVIVPADADRDAIEAAARADERIAALLEGKTIRKVVVVPGKLVNFVAR